MGSRSRLSCGLDVEFCSNLEEEIKSSSCNEYDFICTSIVKPGCTPFENAELCQKVGAMSNTQFLLDSQEWSSLVVGKLSYLPDLTSVITKKRIVAEESVKQELNFVAFLGLPAVVVDLKDDNCTNIARLIYAFLHSGHHNTHIWVRLPLQSPNCQDDTWKWWNKFRTLCNHHPRVGVALDLTSDLPSQLERWPGEPVRSLFVPTSIFLTNKKGYPVLSRVHQHLVSSLFKLDCQVIVTGKNYHPSEKVCIYNHYLNHLYQNSRPVGQYERFSRGYEDYLQAPLQPLMDNLESSTYEIFEKDPIKYEKYQEAVYRCLLDIVPESEAEVRTVVVMVLGAGRGPLVRMSLQGARRAKRKIRCYAVEKNKNATVFLDHLRSTEWKEDDVTIVSADMRSWKAPELADIIVSELLGSFGDNELSPECLDGASRFLKPNAVSIPQSYTSYISPISSHKLYNEIKGVTSLEKGKPPEAAFETPYVVRIHNFHQLTDPLPTFTFNHPNWDHESQNPEPEFYPEAGAEKWEEKFRRMETGKTAKLEGEVVENHVSEETSHNDFKSVDKKAAVLKSAAPSNYHNTRYRQSSCTIPFDTVVHGFAGYFRCSLYKDVEISIEPSTHSPGMFSWFPIFFPLHNPIPVSEGDMLKANFWRCSDERKVWYEWCVAAPQTSQIHNPNGRSYTIGL